MDLQLLIELHKHNPRQGPGSDEQTLKALQLTGLEKTRPLKIADIGCGTGAASLLLAKQLKGEIIAVDFLQEFLDVLQQQAKDQQLNNITPLCCPMEQLPFAEQSLDLIWSEGAIYNMGFENGIKTWRHFLKPDGVLVVSEITWLTDSRPDEIETYWQEQYPEIDTAKNKKALLEKHGYQILDVFTLPESCWLENYYSALQNRFDSFLQQHQHGEAAKAIVDAEQQEIALYKKYKSFYSYGVYIAKKLV